MKDIKEGYQERTFKDGKRERTGQNWTRTAQHRTGHGQDSTVPGRAGHARTGLVTDRPAQHSNAQQNTAKHDES